MKTKIIALIVIVAAAIGAAAYFLVFTSQVVNPPAGGDIGTFRWTDNAVCAENGKPVIRLYSTTWCPHCVWIKETFDAVANEYASQGKIVAYHWELDTGDNTLTEDVEPEVPDSETEIFTTFNPRSSIPTFVFGCKYYRIGNGYEAEGDLEKEADDFRAVIEKLVEAQ